MMRRAFSTNRARNRGAFTLIETVIVIATTALILVTIGTLLAYFYRTNTYTFEHSTAIREARGGIEDALRYLREASYASDGAFPIASVATSTLVFYANVDSDSEIERVRYSLMGGTLYRAVTEPAGNPPAYTGVTATSTIVTMVMNTGSTPLFRYFDDASMELFVPVNISEIASVQTTIVVDANVQRTPLSFTLSGGATLRNLREQL